jgi:integrase
MRGFGDYLVRQGLWTINPLRWMKGPKVTPYSRLPKRIDRAHMEAMWREAARRGGDYSSHLWVTVLAMLYGTGLRRGELERLNVDSFDRAEGTLRIDGRKTGRERCVPLPEIVLGCLEAYLPHRHNQLERAGSLGELCWFGIDVNLIWRSLASNTGHHTHLARCYRLGVAALSGQIKLYETRIPDGLRLYRYGLVQMVKRGLVYLT